MRRLTRVFHAIRPAYRPKVFVVGYLRTGTTSMRRALERLGFKHYGFSADLHAAYKRGDWDALWRVADHYESFDDLPWNRRDTVERLVDHYPMARYVLTVRDVSAWERSMEKHRRRLGRPQMIDGAAEKYAARTAAVRGTLQEAGARYLEMNVTVGDGYDVLCPFLGLPVLNEPFPHANSAAAHEELPRVIPGA